MATAKEAKQVLKRFWIETPSWAYGNSGTRFKVFAQPGVPRDPYEKIADAAEVHKYTGAAPAVAMHIPWDRVENYSDLANHAAGLGVRLGTINSNTFQDDDYKLGSVCHPDAKIRQKAVDHLYECIDIMDITGAQDLKLWFADGTNYPGQDNLSGRQDRLAESLQKVYQRIGANQRMLLEYKFFEPSFYSTDVPDWGTSYAHCIQLGEKASVVVDTGHHAPGTNIEFIVAFLLRQGKLGAFDFNSRFYADDDLIVGTTNPFELFLIFNELVDAGDAAKDVAYMIDQSHAIEPKMEAMIQSVVNIQSAYAKALVVDRKALKERQSDCDVLGAYRVLADAFDTDIRPLLEQVRSELDLAPDPIGALHDSAYDKKIALERGIAEGGGGYPT